MIQGIQAHKNAFKPNIPSAPQFKSGGALNDPTFPLDDPTFRPGAVKIVKPRIPNASIGDLLAAKNGVKDKIGRIDKLGKANETKLNLTA